jgi:hypothetical protein
MFVLFSVEHQGNDQRWTTGVVWDAGYDIGLSDQVALGIRLSFNGCIKFIVGRPPLNNVCREVSYVNRSS